MNPNSAHQIWSRWTFTVTSPAPRRRSLAEVRTHCARFGRKAFRSATEMRVLGAGLGRWTIDVRTEGHPVHDARYTEWMRRQWERFFVEGFGVGTEVTLQTRLEAGSRQDGTPADQLIVLPSIQVSEEGVRYGR